MRKVAPSLGPIATASLRIFIAGFALLIFYQFKKIKIEWRKQYRFFLFIGILNSAIPFALYSFAALHLPASYSVVLNSTSPLFGVVYSAIWLNETFSISKMIGSLLGALGVALIVKLNVNNFGLMEILSIAACLFAANCYALAGVYIKKKSHLFDTTPLAGTSQFLAGLIFLPLLYFFPISAIPSSDVIISLLALSLLCSAVAYLLYFKLMKEVGPTRALTVTFLMPLFGVMWGILFLDENLSVSMLSGAVLILAGTFLVLDIKKAR